MPTPYHHAHQTLAAQVALSSHSQTREAQALQLLVRCSLCGWVVAWLVAWTPVILLERWT